jgi:hypothetical protein
MAKTSTAEVKALRTEDASAFSTHLTGKIAGLDEAGRALVTFEGCHDVPVLAQSTVDAPAPAGEHPDALIGARVLLVFESGEPTRPIIVGILRDQLRPEARRPELRLDMDANRDVVVDGQRLVFDAREEVLLRCGKSTISLQRDGKVLIRGSHLVSRASGPNRIKGGNINLN